ncbi:G-protein coupled receptor Mth2-like [Battus philenor]|uniref:G-protein coupled receptor Mth2-like n=1 Tax=Battus philenor TaxID=42288 RepID=UPI0035CFC7D2
MEKLISIVLFVTFLSGVCGKFEDTFCCKPGQFIHKGNNKTSMCWDPISRTSSSIKVACTVNTMLRNQEIFKFHVNDADYLVVTMPNNEVQLEPHTFCIGNFTLNTNASTLSNASLAAIMCADEDESVVDNSVMAYCMIVSVIFLTITTIIYMMLPEVRDLNGKSIINFCVSLGLGLLCLAIMNLISEYSDMNLCAARGFLTYFFLIASFFWTNAISIQILRSMRRPLTVDYGWREFAWYALYAWGSSAVITIAMSIVNFTPGNHQKPGIGLSHCWFFDKKQQWYYMYSIMTILITANICIFIYTSILLWRHSFASTHIKALKYKFNMTIRLFIIMGVPWIFEMISSLMDKNIIWVITDFVNILQGPLIFLVLVVFRRRVIKAMYKKGMLDCMSDRIEKYLAIGNDEEDNAIQHTMDVPLDEKITVN